MIGEKRVRRIAEERGISIIEAVYGVEHAKEHHKGNFYKMRYLKSKDCETGKMYAYPNGLPNWNPETF